MPSLSACSVSLDKGLGKAVLGDGHGMDVSAMARPMPFAGSAGPPTSADTLRRHDFESQENWFKEKVRKKNQSRRRDAGTAAVHGSWKPITSKR